MGFEAYHGEKLECRMILYPPQQANYALANYGRISQSEEEFDKAARAQPTPTLNANAGKLDPFGRHTLGDENLEREAFRLQPGEVSPLIGTPQGQVVLKCDRRIAAEPGVTLEQERAKLTQEIRRKKTELESLALFKELSDKAGPRLLLSGTGQPEDLAAETKRLTADLPRTGAPTPRR